MDQKEMDALLAGVRADAEKRAKEGYEPQADDGFEVARALLWVLGKRFGAAFVSEVQREVLAHADRVAESDAPYNRDAEEIRKVADAGYFTDLIDDLASGGPSGRA